MKSRGKRRQLAKPTWMCPVHRVTMCVCVCVCFKLFRSYVENSINFLLPHLFQLGRVFQLKNRFVFALLTLDTVIIYHTDSLLPVLTLASIHCAPLSDASW